MNVVIDTNVLVAGLAANREDSPPRRILAALQDGAHVALVSPAWVAEYREVLNRPRSSGCTAFNHRFPIASWTSWFASLPRSTLSLSRSPHLTLTISTCGRSSPLIPAQCW